MTCFSDPGQSGRADGPAPCPVCEAGAVDGDLCPTHRALAERDVPARLEKRTPPKGADDYLSVASLFDGLDVPEPERRWWEDGHATPDWLWTVALILFIFLLLESLGALR